MDSDAFTYLFCRMQERRHGKFTGFIRCCQDDCQISSAQHSLFHDEPATHRLFLTLHLITTPTSLHILVHLVHCSSSVTSSRSADAS